jgi:hypothetical protein
MKSNFVLPHAKLALQTAIDALDSTKKWRVTIEPYRKRRSLEQNSYLHAVPLKVISDKTGYEVDDLKQYLMGQAFGWEEYELFGQMRRRPRLGTSDLNTEQFAWFIEWIAAWAAQELELSIPMPKEDYK